MKASKLIEILGNTIEEKKDFEVIFRTKTYGKHYEFDEYMDSYNPNENIKVYEDKEGRYGVVELIRKESM